MNHKNGKIAREIIELQNADGTWGHVFHSLAQPNKKYPLTMEQALRRLKILGFTINDVPIRKAVDCMISCLQGVRKIDNYWEKTLDWELFTQLMLATWVKVFEPENETALQVAVRWAKVFEEGFKSGEYSERDYFGAYQQEFDCERRAGNVVSFSPFYHLQLLQGVISEEVEKRLVDYVLSKADGIYYVYDKSLCELPKEFASRESARYLAAIELLSGYKSAKERLKFVVAWLEDNQEQNGQWDLGAKAKDNIYLPLSDSWTKAEYRKADCTEWIVAILNKIM